MNKNIFIFLSNKLVSVNTILPLMFELKNKDIKTLSAILEKHYTKEKIKYNYTMLNKSILEALS